MSSNIHATPQQIAAPGFWTKLAVIFESLGESYAERLDKRVNRLEAEVERLSAIQKKLPRS